MLINFMWAVIWTIPVWTLLLSVWYIFNDRIAEVAEKIVTKKICLDSECTAPRCVKRSPMFI